MKSKLESTELAKIVEIYRYPQHRGMFLFACHTQIRQSDTIREKLHTRRSRRGKGIRKSVTCWRQFSWTRAILSRRLHLAEEEFRPTEQAYRDSGELDKGRSFPSCIRPHSTSFIYHYAHLVLAIEPLHCLSSSPVPFLENELGKRREWPNPEAMLKPYSKGSLVAEIAGDRKNCNVCGENPPRSENIQSQVTVG